MAAPEACPSSPPPAAAVSPAKPKSARRVAEETNPDFQLPGIGNYFFVKTLGEGNFAKVKLAKHKMTAQEVAIKIIDKSQLEEKKIAKLYREVRIMKMLHHPHIVRLYEVIETKFTVFLVMEYSSGGELYDYLVVHGRMKEKEARAKFRQILGAMSYCHKKRIIHRDLKAENLLMDSNLDIKIADFGFSNQYDPEGKLDTFCGSPPYAAPELFQGRRYVGPEVDIWSLGVILYVLTTGCLPFDGKNLVDMREAVCRGRYRIPFYLTDGCEKLLRKLLVRDSSKRSSLEMLIDDPWIMEGFSTSPITVDLSAKVAEDENLVRMISQKFNITPETILQSLRENLFNDTSALYYLMYHERDRTGDYSRVSQVLSASSPTSPTGPSLLSPTLLLTPNLSPDKAVSGQVGVVPELNLRDVKDALKVPTGDNKGSSQSTNEPSPKSAGPSGAPSALSRVSALNGSRRRRFTMGGGEKKPEIAPAKETQPPSTTTVVSKETKPPKPQQISALGAVLTAVRGERKSSAKTIETSSTASSNGSGSTSPTKTPEQKEEPFRKRNNTIAGIFSTFTRAGRSAMENDSNHHEVRINTETERTAEHPAPPVVASSGEEEMKPRVLRFTFSKKSTSEMSPKEIRSELQRVLVARGIVYKMTQPCVAECLFVAPSMREPSKFEVEICRLPGLKTHGLRFNRLSGNPSDYKQVLETLLETLKL